jgi:hypothetical protein
MTEKQAEIEVGDVVQLNPDDKQGPDWGPVFAVVDEIRAWGVIASMYIPEQRGAPAVAPIRLEHSHFVRIGKARWRLP